jgi:hypothetical protein
MNRNITGTIRKTDGTVWAGAVVEFELERSSFDQEAQYPSKPVRAVADADGELDLVLWVNEEGLRPSKYICTLPDGSQFRFTLPEGGTPVDLNELRESAIEEDSPTASQVVAFLPIMRQEARQVVEEELVAVNAEIDTKADQTALDATDANVTQIVQDLDALSHQVDSKAAQADLNTTNANLAATNANLAAANTAIATKASQSALNTTNANLEATNLVVGSKAKQSDLDTTNANVHTLTQAVDLLDGELESKADQSELNITNENVGQLQVDLFTLDGVVATKANQSALNTTNANLATTNSNLAATNTNLAAANTAIAAKANQSSLDTTNTNVSTLSANLFAANGVIATKANQSSLDTTNANVTTVTNGLAAANTAIAAKASQADLNTANAEIAIRARQTALNTTNSNLAALSTVVDTKAAQSALDTAVTNLQDAISAAQSTLQGLIAQKANLVHTHQAVDVKHTTHNAIGYFNNSGDLTASSQLTYAGGKLGLGTNDPEFTLDLRDSNASAGNNSRISAVLNSSSPILQLTSDSGVTNPTAIVLECAGMTNNIESDIDGNLSFGMEGTTSNITFRMLESTTSFRGLKVGYAEPTEIDFPPYSFGFYQMVSHFGPHSTIEFDLVFNDGETLQVLPFSSKGGGVEPLDP